MAKPRLDETAPLRSVRTRLRERTLEIVMKLARPRDGGISGLIREAVELYVAGKTRRKGNA